MAFVEISPELAATNKLLERIAAALEMIVLKQYGIRLGSAAEAIPDPNPREKPEVGYETDAARLRRDLEDFAKQRDPMRVIDDDV